jgi:uncharacterized secreted repeat protein (TIGR03808 family)
MDWTIDRRNLLAFPAAGLAAGAAAAPAQAATSPGGIITFDGNGLDDASGSLQQAIDRAGRMRAAVLLAPGRITLRKPVRLPSLARLFGAGALSVIACRDEGRLIGEGARDLVVADLRLEGTPETHRSPALIDLNACRDARLSGIEITAAPADGIRLWRSSSRIDGCRMRGCQNAAIRAGDSAGVVIERNVIEDIANNGIVVWRETAATDGTQVIANRISRIRADGGGSGQNGNGINAFRADHVLIANNTIADCAFSAVRCNSASNVQIVANNCRNLGEVALYAEFAFQGAVIANNLVAGAATGIVVTNFNDGGRLATVQGNVIRELFRREAEPIDKRGVGIAVEADTAVSGNTIENAPTAGIMIGWGSYLRQVNASSNIIRGAAVGIGLSLQGGQGQALIATNMISNARDGHVRHLDHGIASGTPARDGDGTYGAARLVGNVFS